MRNFSLYSNCLIAFFFKFFIMFLIEFISFAWQKMTQMKFVNIYELQQIVWERKNVTCNPKHHWKTYLHTTFSLIHWIYSSFNALSMKFLFNDSLANTSAYFRCIFCYFPYSIYLIDYDDHLVHRPIQSDNNIQILM